MCYKHLLHHPHSRWFSVSHVSVFRNTKNSAALNRLKPITKVRFAHSRVQIFRKAQLLFRARSCASLLFHRTHFPMKEQRKCPEGTSLTMKTYMVKKSFGALSFPVPHLITAGGKCFPITLLSTLPAQSVHRYCLFSYIQHLPVLFPHY